MAGSEAAARNRAVLLEVWPQTDYSRLSDIGHRRAIVFSPDFGSSHNRLFYTRLGFVYYEDASWSRVLERIALHNQNHPENAITLVIVETHGTNGEGLKLERSSDQAAGRSYASIGGLQERLAQTGVRYCVIAACNAGRLYRPRTYTRLSESVTDPLFRPATEGIVNASPGFDPAGSPLTVLRRKASHLERISEIDFSELSSHARILITGETESGGRKFAISDMFVQLLLNDAQLELTGKGFDPIKSRFALSEKRSEALVQRFLRLIDSVAEKEYNDLR